MKSFQNFDKMIESEVERIAQLEKEEETRRGFLAKLGAGAAGIALGGAALSTLISQAQAAAAAAVSDRATSAPLAGAAQPAAHPAQAAANPASTFPADLSVFRGQDDPAANCRAAVEALGGMKRFVKKGDVVVVKPNIGWDRTPEQAANTNPQVVAELVKMALNAGAKEVKVFDNTCNNARSCYVRSGIEAAAREAGAKVLQFSDERCKTIKVPDGEFLKEWPVLADGIECDVYINCPVAKVHGISKLTLGMKNAMGVIGGNRGHWHKKIDLALSEFLGVIKPQLTIVDAWRTLVAHGPTGGNVADVRMPKICIASADPVAADARAAALFKIDPKDLGFILKAAARGFGQCDLTKVKTIEKV